MQAYCHTIGTGRLSLWCRTTGKRYLFLQLSHFLGSRLKDSTPPPYQISFSMDAAVEGLAAFRYPSLASFYLFGASTLGLCSMHAIRRALARSNFACTLAADIGADRG